MSDTHGTPDAYSPIPELNQLKACEDRQEGRWYADGFELRGFGHDFGLVHWLDTAGAQDAAPPHQLSRLTGFADATGSGSFYALWYCDDRSDLATLPVIRFGDEGGLDVVGCGLRDPFRLSPSTTSGSAPSARSRSTPTATRTASPGWAPPSPRTT